MPPFSKAPDIYARQPYQAAEQRGPLSVPGQIDVWPDL